MIHRGFLFMRIFLFLLLAVQVCQGQLRFEERVHDFGLIQGDDKRYTDFVAVNDGKKPINILRVDNFRDREVQSLISKVYLLPGEKAYIRVQINPLKEGRFSKDLAVYTTYNNKTIKLTVKGNTKNLADLQRQSCPDFNDNRNSAQKASFKSIILVEDAITGEPIKKAKVELIQSNYGLETKEFTSSNGECTVQLNPGLIQSQISADGYETINAPMVVKRSDAFHRIKLMPLNSKSAETENTFAQNVSGNQNETMQNPYENEGKNVDDDYESKKSDESNATNVDERDIQSKFDSDTSNPYDEDKKTVSKLPKENKQEVVNDEVHANPVDENISTSKFETDPINPYDFEEKSVDALPVEEIDTSKTIVEKSEDEPQLPDVEEKSMQNKFDSNVIVEESNESNKESEAFNPYDDEVKTVANIAPQHDTIPKVEVVESVATNKFDTEITDDEIVVSDDVTESTTSNESIIIEEKTSESKFDAVDETVETDKSEPVFETEGFEESKFKANNVVFLIDKSISMRNEEKLDITKKAVIYLINRFRSIDNLGVVVYDTDAEVLIPSASGDVVKNQIKDIEKLEASGKTFGAKGLREAYEMDLANFKPSGVNQIFIVTDGGFSEDISKVERVAKRCAAKNIRLHILGVKNQKWTEKTFEAMAEISGGSYIHLSDIANAEELLFNFIKSNSSTE
tara:strand:- start:282 stop:2336 length:2055 start_codon:yes stop_codon:yes gene_type:complete